MHKIVFTCTTLRNSKATDVWISSAAIVPAGPDTFVGREHKDVTTRRPQATEINDKMHLTFNGVKWIASSELKRQHSKVLCFKITAAEIHFYAFSLWDHKALYSRSMKKVITT